MRAPVHATVLFTLLNLSASCWRNDRYIFDDILTRITKAKAAHLFEVVGHLELALLRGNVGLDLRVRVVDDGQEHVEQNEEHEEHVEDEVGGAEDAVRLLQSLEVEVAQNDAEQRETVQCHTDA